MCGGKFSSGKKIRVYIYKGPRDVFDNSPIIYERQFLACEKRDRRRGEA